MRRWGYREFLLEILPGSLQPGITILDIGGGKKPAIDAASKKRLALRIFGLDIDANELDKAPEHVYDRKIAADICTANLDVEADLVIALAVLEHVVDSRAAVRSIAKMLKPGGRALIFVPGRNSIYARLNLMLPQTLKRFLLRTIFPGSLKQQGFYSYYDKCTPKALKNAASECNLLIEEEQIYYQCDYFSFFLPLQALYRGLTLLLIRVLGTEAAETFTLVLSKPGVQIPKDAS